MTHETAADVETAGLLSMEENPGQSRPSRTLRVAVLTIVLCGQVAFILHWQQPHSNQADTKSSIVADALPYDCDAGRWNAFNGWSPGKQTWCCATQQKGCTGDPLVTGVAPNGAVATAANPNNYDCDAGRWNAYNGWSDGKKAWCCTTQQKGCAGDPVVTGVYPGSGAAAFQTQPAFAAGANPNNYDCDAGRWNAHNGWSVGKQAWCCANQQKGCANDQVVTGGGAGIANPGVAPFGNPNNYDCDAGRWNANNGWSEDKKSWCCIYQHKGCLGDQVDTGR